MTDDTEEADISRAMWEGVRLGHLHAEVVDGVVRFSPTAKGEAALDKEVKRLARVRAAGGRS